MFDQVDEKYIEQLIQEVGSKNNNTALRAVTRLRQLGCLTDGTLARAKLRGANLQGAQLSYADLKQAFLGWAKLQDAVMVGVNLDGAILWSANLQGANLEKANLRKAVLENAFFNEDTILPDGSHWSSDANLAGFTHPDKADAWYPVRFPETLDAAIRDLTPPELYDFTLGKPVGEPYDLFNMSWRLTKGKSRKQINRLIMYLYRLSEEARKRAGRVDSREASAYWLGVSSGLRRSVLELRLEKRDSTKDRSTDDE
ncbi:MAG: pentapeptide repeat-containing protein [Anaerolineae bacterium]|nr:pentapeptide repeat-containing protein [Anaerolineae bacterium]